MSRIRGKETKPEILIRKFLFSKGFRYRKNYKNLAGSPDIVLPKYKTAIFINGCFWHGHKNCRAAHLPATRTEYWIPKIKANIDRDKRNNRKLRKEGWKVITVWQCQIKNRAKMEQRMKRLAEQI